MEKILGMVLEGFFVLFRPYCIWALKKKQFLSKTTEKFWGSILAKITPCLEIPSRPRSRKYQETKAGGNTLVWSERMQHAAVGKTASMMQLANTTLYPNDFTSIAHKHWTNFNENHCWKKTHYTQNFCSLWLFLKNQMCENVRNFAQFCTISHGAKFPLPCIGLLLARAPQHRTPFSWGAAT